MLELKRIEVEKKVANRFIRIKKWGRVIKVESNSPGLRRR